MREINSRGLASDTLPFCVRSCSPSNSEYYGVVFHFLATLAFIQMSIKSFFSVLLSVSFIRFRFLRLDQKCIA